MISIYINYFAPAHIFKNEYLTPIQVGKAGSKHDLKILGDDEGDNISSRNAEFCELTGQYYVWKNQPGQQYYGFMHYRRLLDLSLDESRKTDVHGLIPIPAPYPSLLHDFGLDEASIERALEGCDAIVPRAFDVTSLSAPSVREQYRTAPYHFVDHLDLAGKIIDELQPSYSRFFKKAIHGKYLYPNNIFIFNEKLFNEYSEWLFGILFELDRRIDVSDCSWQEKRAIGYVAERLFTIFVLKKIEDKDVRFKFAERIFITDPAASPSAPSLPQTNLPVVTIAAATDDHYVQHMAALVSSVLSTASHTRYIDFLVLDGGISVGDKNRLLELEVLHPNCRISFVDMSKEHLDLSTNSYFTRGTFYRLSLPALLEDRQKVLYLDTDLVVVRDVTELYDTPLNDALLAGVRDLVMKSFAGGGVHAIAEIGNMKCSRYLSDKLGIRDPSDYFQAGVLLLNLDRLRAQKVADRMISALRHEKFWFLDQDVFNKYARGRVKYLSAKWNVVYMDDAHLQWLDDSDRSTYQAALDDPWIVHYAGLAKPWKGVEHPHASRYWSALRFTSWYETGLFQLLTNAQHSPTSAPMTNQPPGEMLYRKSMLLWLLRKTWRGIPFRLRRRFIPLGTRIKRKIAGGNF